MDKEAVWMAKRLGRITASELGQIVSASGKIIDTNLNFIRAKRFERKRGFAHPITSRAMEIGNEQEKYAVEWARTNLGLPEIVYSKDLPEIPFWEAPDCPLGASPDAFTPDEESVIEIKTLVGATAIDFFADEYTSYEEKKIAVWKEHGDQLCGQFLSNPKVRSIQLVKYIFCDDYIDADTDSPLAPWRGIVFKFERKDYEASIEEMRQRIILINAMIDAPINPSEYKKGEWVVFDDGQLKKK